MTQQQIANEIGVSRQTLSKWKRDGMETTVANLDALRAKAGSGKEKTEIGRAIQEARLRKLLAEAAAKEHALQVERGNYVTIESQIRDGSLIGQTVKSLFLKIPAELPQIILGLDYPDAVTSCEDYVYQILADLHESGLRTDDDKPTTDSAKLP
jgi:transcriptional regulator with XRE-family HTH domain